MAKITFHADEYTVIVADYVKIKDYKKDLEATKKENRRIEKIHKAKSWKHNLTK